MAIRGPEALNSLDEALRDIRREEDEIAKRLARSNERVAKFRETETDLVRQLAMLRLDPAVQAQLRGNGMDSWIGWPTSPKLEELRVEWFHAPDLAAEKAIGRKIQEQAFIDIPYLPMGQFSGATAYNKRLTDVLRGYALFWNVKKSA